MGSSNQVVHLLLSPRILYHRCIYFAINNICIKVYTKSALEDCMEEKRMVKTSAICCLFFSGQITAYRINKGRWWYNETHLKLQDAATHLQHAMLWRCAYLIEAYFH